MPKTSERTEAAKGPAKQPQDEPAETKLSGVPSHVQSAGRDLLDGASGSAGKPAGKNREK